MAIPLTIAKEHAYKTMKLVMNLAKQWQTVGQIRMGEEDINRIDIVLNISERRLEKLKSVLGKAGRTLMEGYNLIIVKSKFEVLVYIHLANKENYPFQTLFKTGPKPFLKAMINLSHSKELILNENGIVNKDVSICGIEDEGAIFGYLGIEYLKPEQRLAITNMEQLKC